MFIDQGDTSLDKSTNDSSKSDHIFIDPTVEKWAKEPQQWNELELRWEKRSIKVMVSSCYLIGATESSLFHFFSSNWLVLLSAEAKKNHRFKIKLFEEAAYVHIL